MSMFSMIYDEFTKLCTVKWCYHWEHETNFRLEDRNNNYKLTVSD